MGFYSAATLVEDARRHAVEVRPIDVLASRWDCTLEPARGGPHRFAVRMGMRLVKGLGEKDGRRIAERAPYHSIDDLSRRVGLDDKPLHALAEAGAFEALDPSRRSALWRSRGAARPLPLSVETDEIPGFADLTWSEKIGWDYARSGHSTRGHPLEPLREELRAQGLPDAQTVAAMKHGRRVRYAGLVICRQRPGTASGVTFMTLEDESGFVNLVIWRRVFEKYPLLARTRSFLGVTGKLQTQDGVVNLVVEELWEPVVRAPPGEVESHDFH